MPKFRKKPVVIEAEQVRAGEIGDLISSAIALGIARTTEHDEVLISTLEGEMLARPGDWIIKGVKGEFYPCKPDIFAATYELIKNEEAYTVLDALMNNDPRVRVSGGPRLDHEGADIRQKPPRNLLEEPPEGWFVERDERTKNPTGNLVRTEDGVRKWYTDPMFRESE